MQQGGAINIQSNYSIRVMFERCLFDHCIAFSNTIGGGGIYFSATQGSICLSQVCGYDCYVNNDKPGQFASLIVGASNNLVLTLLSMSQCAPISSLRNSAINLENGNQTFNNLNISRGYTSLIAGMRIFGVICCNAKYCTMANNCASSSQLIYFDSPSSLPGKFEYFNVIANQSPLLSIIYLYVPANYLNLYYGLFYNNEVNLFGIKSGSCLLFLYHSLVFSPIMTSFTTVTSSNCTIISSEVPTYKFSHFSTYMCYNKDIIDLLNECNVPHPSVFPSPTECIFGSNDGQSSISIVNLFQIAMCAATLIIGQ